MTGYFGAIEKDTLKNEYFRQVLYTGKFAQLVVMCLQPGEEIGNEIHDHVDQFFRVETGRSQIRPEWERRASRKGKRSRDRSRWNISQCDQYLQNTGA